MKRMVFKMWFDLKHSLVYKEVTKVCYCSSTKYHLEFAVHAQNAHAHDIIKSVNFLVQRNATISNVLCAFRLFIPWPEQIFLISLENRSRCKNFYRIPRNPKKVPNVYGQSEMTASKSQATSPSSTSLWKSFFFFFLRSYGKSGKNMGTVLVAIDE